MERSIFQSQVAEVKDCFAETFGRGCLIKFKEASYSQRNQFELQKLNAERAGRTGGLSHKHWLPSGEMQLKKQLGQASRCPNRCSDFERIDEINTKICGLIKSISSSCHKKTPLDLKIERDSSKKAFPSSHTASKETKIDYQKTQKKKKDLEQEGHIKAKLIHFNLDQKAERYANKNGDVQFHYKNVSNTQNECFVDMNDRIKKINDKISNYENKIKDSIKGPKIIVKDDTVSHRPLREYRDFDNIHQTPNKVNAKQPIQKFTQNCMKYILNERQNSNAKPKQSHHSTQVKRGDDGAELFRKTALFNEKYTQFTAKNAKQQLQTAFDPFKISKNEQIIDRKQMEEKKYGRLQKNAIAQINGQLLSYKTQFLKELVKQIGLDQEFRHAKHIFGGIEGLFDQGNPSQKWTNLQRQLKSEGFNLPLPEVKEIFMPRDDEIDPFMSVSQSHEQLVHGLIHSYRSCERNWNENMHHSWSLWELRESKFTAENLDQARKGGITLEDLTFYLNTELDGNYRNRDLMLIFNRLRGAKPKTKGAPEKAEEVAIRFKDIIDKLLSA